MGQLIRNGICYSGSGGGDSGITVMSQKEFDAIENKASLGIVGICNGGYEITKLIDASKYTEGSAINI